MAATPKKYLALCTLSFILSMQGYSCFAAHELLARALYQTEIVAVEPQENAVLATKPFLLPSATPARQTFPPFLAKYSTATLPNNITSIWQKLDRNIIKYNTIAFLHYKKNIIYNVEKHICIQFLI